MRSRVGARFDGQRDRLGFPGSEPLLQRLSHVLRYRPTFKPRSVSEFLASRLLDSPFGDFFPNGIGYEHTVVELGQEEKVTAGAQRNEG